MQNQCLTEPKAVYTPPDAVQTELAIAETQSAQNAQAVHKWLANILQKTRRDKIRYWTIFLALELIGGLLMFLFVVVAMLSSSVNPLMRSVLGPLVLGAFYLIFETWLKKPKWSAEEIARIGGTQAVGTLLDLLTETSNLKQRRPLCVALIEVLPQMKVRDAVLLTKGQRRLLYEWLRGGFNPGADASLLLCFRLAILKTMEQIGDAEAVLIVERMANSKARTAEQKQIKVAAQECMPLLRVTFGTVEANKTLLRASSPALAAPETLLRPSEFTRRESKRTAPRFGYDRSPAPFLVRRHYCSSSSLAKERCGTMEAGERQTIFFSKGFFMPLVYRSMREEAGQPKIERSPKGLGVRIEGENSDIHVRADSSVEPAKEGMSVAPLPKHLPTHRVYRGLRHLVEGAESKDSTLRIWRMGDGPFVRADITSDLLLLPDPVKAGVVEHGVIAPTRKMPITEYEAALANTQSHWAIDETGK